MHTVLFVTLLLVLFQGFKMSQAFDNLKTEIASVVVLMAKSAQTLADLNAKIPSPENVVDPADVAATATALTAGAATLQAALDAVSPPAPVTVAGTP